MALDTTTPYEPGWWLVRLAKRLVAERPAVDRLDRLFRGDHPLPVGADTDQEKAEAYRRFMRMSRTNYLSLVVEAPLERLRVTGFRAGVDDRTGDAASWDLWQRARLDAVQSQVTRTKLVARRSYVIVGPHPRRKGEVLITAEHPSQVIAEAYPDDARELRAALKLFADDATSTYVAYVYLPQKVYRYRSPKVSAGELSSTAAFTAEGMSGWTLEGTSKNPTAPELPVVEFANRPDLLNGARGEFEDVIDIQNRINQTIFHRLAAEKFASFRQTAILNLAFDEDDEGNPIAPDLPSEPGLAWLLQGDNLRMWQSEQTSTADILKAVEADVRDLAAITRTPPHYLLNGLVNISGDALTSAETALIAKVREHIAQDSDGWEQVIHLGHVVKGTPRAAADLEALWADPESRTLGELYDAANKAVGAGVPWRGRMELLGKSPSEIDRWEAERTQDALMAALTAPQPAVPGAAQTFSTAAEQPAEAPVDQAAA